MKYFLNYAVICHKGKVRSKNQDNFWCMGAMLKSENEGLPEPIANTYDIQDSPAFAVFDGMGGELHGEVAAYLAATVFDAAYKENGKNDSKAFLLDACRKMNQAICEYAARNHIRSTGTTAAILKFGAKNIYICNVGDSRVYQYSGKKMTQISHDHSEISVTDRKPPLTQNLGIPETEFFIEPYIAKGAYENGDKYLICSDGLTDMVNDMEIAEIIERHNDLAECVNILLQKALDRGGKDNITIILCELRKQTWTSNLNKTIQKIAGGANK